MLVKGAQLWNQVTWIQLVPSPLSSCVNMGKLQSYSRTEFPQLQKGWLGEGMVVLSAQHQTPIVLSCLVVFDSLWPHGLQPTRLLCPWGFSRQEYWSGLPCLPPGDLPNPGIEPRYPTLQADSLLTEPPGKPWPPLPEKYWPAGYGIVALGPGELKSYGLKGRLFLVGNNRSSQGFKDRLTATMTFQGR